MHDEYSYLILFFPILVNEEEILRYSNFDMDSIVMPVNANELKRLLLNAGYDAEKTEYLFRGFSQGFDLGYRGPTNRRNYSENIPIKVGTQVDMWNKVMEEVRLGRYAGPFRNKPPFDEFMQSPIGLVPKAGNKTRLIFHLSYDFGPQEQNKSFNYHTPEELCSVKYRDLDHAIENCLKLLDRFPDLEVIFFAKSDLTAAFRQIPGNPKFFRWLCLKAMDLETNEIAYFFNKCMPFGASISCAIFQEFSNALHFLIQYQIQKRLRQPDAVTNYLDDFLFLAITQWLCNVMVNMFIQLCNEINLPISEEKTEKASPLMIFLGILMDGRRKILVIPEEKRLKAILSINTIIGKKKAKVKQIQCLTGLLNFINRAITPGRAFTRRMYAKIPTMKKNKSLKHYHHVTIDSEFHEDCKVWLSFLARATERSICSPFLDIRGIYTSRTLDFHTDVSRAINKGFGCVYGTQYTWGQWEPNYIEKYEPSIEYLRVVRSDGWNFDMVKLLEKLQDYNFL